MFIYLFIYLLIFFFVVGGLGMLCYNVMSWEERVYISYQPEKLCVCSM